MAPTFHASEARQHATFTALMWALSYPGRVQTLPTTGLTAFAAIAEALVDLETSYYCADPELATLLAQTGGRLLPIAQAAYQFYPQLDEHTLESLTQAPIGSFADPEDGATLVLGCRSGAGQRCVLRGPGIQGTSEMLIAGLPTAFWELRARSINYPLGWDCFLVAGDQLIGLPRTTIVEVH
jgi:alpha-D-ribose 1-methylphosphonate 5-triphosphate synthase subunit PhnH